MNEQRVIRAVLKLGKEYGYGKLIAHLKRAWQISLIETYGHSSESAAREAKVAALPLPNNLTGPRDLYSFYYIDTYGIRVYEQLTHEQAEALTGWIVTSHLAGLCNRCGFASDDPKLLRFDPITDGLICPRCKARMKILTAPAPPKPWGNGEWIGSFLGEDKLSSIWVGLQGKYPEFAKKRWLERNKTEGIPKFNDPNQEKKMKKELKDLRARVEQLEYPMPEVDDTAKLNADDRYEQLKVAVQDMLIELDITPDRIEERATKIEQEPFSEDSASKMSYKTCQKLIDAGVLENVRITGETRWRDNT